MRFRRREAPRVGLNDALWMVKPSVGSVFRIMSGWALTDDTLLFLVQNRTSSRRRRGQVRLP